MVVISKDSIKALGKGTVQAIPKRSMQQLIQKSITFSVKTSKVIPIRYGNVKFKNKDKLN